MVFSSLTFLFVFLPAVLALYTITFVLPSRAGWNRVAILLGNALLLLASLIFYTWGEKALVLMMLASITVDYTCSLFIAGDGKIPGPHPAPLPEGQPRSRRQKAFLVGSLVFNLGALAVFKYFNFGIENALAVLDLFGVESPYLRSLPYIALPIGISFYTFQSMSYTIDVYRGHVDATRSWLNYAAYVSLFPQLVAGPIVRYADVAEQLRGRTVSWLKFGEGVERFVIGLAKKVLIANTVAGPADQIFSQHPDQLSPAVAWLGIVCYSLQIYFDFSGYSDMAIGLGKMFGFDFMENFRYPYVSRSIKEFWRRWHISLSTWFRDYVYIPLGGNRVPRRRQYLNLWVVFLLTGLWHGASWTFIVWGAYHGLFLVLERGRWGTLLDRLPSALQHLYTLLVIMAGWVFFRSESMAYAGAYFQAMVWPGAGTLPLSMYLRSDVLAAVLLGALFATPIARWAWDRASAWIDERRSAPAPLVAGLRLSGFLALLLLATMQLSAGTYNPFIYFRF